MLIDKEKLARQRYTKYRNIGFFDTGTPLQSASIPTGKSNTFMSQVARFLGIK